MALIKNAITLDYLRKFLSLRSTESLKMCILGNPDSSGPHFDNHLTNMNFQQFDMAKIFASALFAK